MRKEELRKLRSLPATSAIIREAKFDIERNESYGWSYKKSWKEPKWKVLCRAQQLGKYIKVALFLPGDIRKGIKTPKYEIYVDTTAEDYITRELDAEGKEVRWLTAMIGNLPGIDIYNYYSRTQREIHYLTQDTKQTLNRQLVIKGEPDSDKGQHQAPKFKLTEGLLRLRKWQQDVKDEETKRREEREVAPWDADMKLVPKDTPKSFVTWMSRDVCKDHYIFYEYVSGGADKGFCSRCHSEVPIIKPKHNTPTKCPRCKAKATFKAAGKSKTLATEVYYGQLIQKIDGGIVIREFSQDQRYGTCKGYRSPYVRTNEWERVIITDDGDMRRYCYELYKNKYHRWCLRKENAYYSGYHYGSGMALYRRNFKAIEKSKVFEHSAINLWPELPMNVVGYLKTEAGNPAVEMLAKLGMFKLAKDLIRESYDKNLLKEDATEIAKLLKIDNSRLKRLKAMDGNVKHLRWMQYEKMVNTIWPDDMIKGFGDAGLLSSDFGFLNPPVSYVKIYNYLTKQSELMQEDIHQVMVTWRDYHNMADQLKMNIKLEQISRPKDLKAAHDEVILIRESKGIKKQAAELRKKWPKAEKHLERLEKFEYKSDKYQIVSPKSLDDIVKEGVILKHCVHTCDYYFSRIQSDESYLFFLRKVSSPDMPWYTLEVEPSGNIRQKRTTGDNQNKDFEDAIEFLKEWQKYFAKQLTKKEKKLGEKSNELRKENYKNLRKNQNRVWHGKLAGQLLADVLEADFMAVAGGI